MGFSRRIQSALFVFCLALFSGEGLSETPLKVIAVGDSLTAGYGLAKEQSFPSRLQDRLNEDGVSARVVNAGVSGDTSAGGLARIAWVLADDPDAVILELGANDALRGLEPEGTYKNLKGIIEKLDAAGVPVLLAGMRAPPNFGPEYGQAFEAVFARLAKEHNVVFYPFFLEGVAARPNLNQDDGIHPNAEGVDVIVGRILPAVQTLISRARTLQ